MKMIYKKSKFKNVWSRCKSGHNHQSKKESNYCDQLLVLKKTGKEREAMAQQMLRSPDRFAVYNANPNPNPNPNPSNPFGDDDGMINIILAFIHDSDDITTINQVS